MEKRLEKDLCNQHCCSVLLPHPGVTEMFTQFVKEKVDTDSTFKNKNNSNKTERLIQHSMDLTMGFVGGC